MPSKLVSVGWWVQVLTTLFNIMIQLLIWRWSGSSVNKEFDHFMLDLYSADLVGVTIALCTVLTVTDMFRKFMYRLAAMAKSLVGMLILGVIFVIGFNHVWWFTNFAIWEPKNIAKFDMKLNIVQTVDTMFNHWGGFMSLSYQTDYFHLFFMAATMLGLNLVITKFMIAFVVDALNASNADRKLAGQLQKLHYIVECLEMTRVVKRLKKDPAFYDKPKKVYTDFELDHVFDAHVPGQKRYADYTWIERSGTVDPNDKYIYVVTEKVDAAISKEKADATKVWRSKIEAKVDIIKDKVEMMEINYDVNENKLVDLLKEVRK